MKISNVIGAVVGIGIGLAVTSAIIDEAKKENIKDNKKIKVFISTPMTGLSEAKILSDIEKAKKDIKILLGHKTDNYEIEFIHNFTPNIEESDTNNSIKCLGNAILILANCDYIYFNKGWENSRGCCIEHDVAKRYSVRKLYCNN